MAPWCVLFRNQIVCDGSSPTRLLRTGIKIRYAHLNSVTFLLFIRSLGSLGLTRVSVRRWPLTRPARPRFLPVPTLCASRPDRSRYMTHKMTARPLERRALGQVMGSVGLPKLMSFAFRRVACQVTFPTFHIATAVRVEPSVREDNAYYRFASFFFNSHLALTSTPPMVLADNCTFSKKGK